MTVLEAYQKYLMKVNRNDSNSNIQVPKGKFVLIFNQEARRWEQEKFQLKQGSRELDDLQSLLVLPTKLKRVAINSDSVDYELFKNFFGFASSYSIVKNGKCERRIDNWEVKTHNVPTYLIDSNHRPSFEWEESLLQIGNDIVRVFTDDFKIKDTYFSYYRFPKDIDIEGYIRLDGKASTNIDPELDDLVTDEIISRAALETIRNSQNPDAFPFAKDRISTEEIRK